MNSSTVARPHSGNGTTANGTPAIEPEAGLTLHLQPFLGAQEDPHAEAFASAREYFPTPIQEFQFYDKYSRFDYEKGRRETWIETVDRAVSFLNELVQTNANQSLDPVTLARIRNAILGLQAMPSMRLLSMAGQAARRDNAAIYNCSFLPVDSLDSFREALLISMAGCGVGFSVEKQWIDQLPRVQIQDPSTVKRTHVIKDSAEGWGNALITGLQAWFYGEDVVFNYSQVRPAGAILRTKGGRASGPEPLKVLLEFARTRILAKQGQTLTALDVHDIMCMVGNAAVSGGMRRTAMISLFDHDDEEMLFSKNGDYWAENWQRSNANNSAVWPLEGLAQSRVETLVREMVQGMRGEPGIFNRKAMVDLMPERRDRSYADRFGANPCGEITLRPYQFCNLSIAVARADDDIRSLLDKVEIATIIGTIQSLATHFPSLRPIWKRNCAEERLLGVDINGQMDCPLVQDPVVMEALRLRAVETNRAWAKRFGIPQSASVTCVKPSGNSAQLLGCASGIHARWAEYYIRNVRVSATSPVFQVLREAGAPMDPENGQTAETANTWVVHFPVASPEGAVIQKNRSAIEQCDYWLRSKLHWTEHNPSVTITYRPDEVEALIAWIVEHQDYIGGMAFLPASDAKYEQMPYEEIDRVTYERLAAAFPEIDYARLVHYEREDLTTAAQEVACMSGACAVEFEVPVS